MTATVETPNMAQAPVVKNKKQELDELDQKLFGIEYRLMKLSVKKAIADKTACLDKFKEERDNEIQQEKEVSVSINCHLQA